MTDSHTLYMQREASRAQAQMERADMLKRLHDEMDKQTPRARRARHHANVVLAIFDKYVPEACRADAFECAMLNFFAQDFDIVPVPPERDAEAALKLRVAMTTISPKPVISGGLRNDRR